jgi:hypothetical protein
MLNTKAKEWFKRYGPPEVASLLMALIFSNLTMAATHNSIVSAYVGTWMNNLGFYGLIVFVDMKARHAKNNGLTFADFIKQFRNSIVEFGPAEYLDSFAIRPFCLWFFPRFIHDYTLAVFIGTLLADVGYFVPTIFSYEFRKKAWKD